MKNLTGLKDLLGLNSINYNFFADLRCLSKIILADIEFLLMSTLKIAATYLGGSIIKAYIQFYSFSA